ncbi:zinc-dependent alcohol dehydrogenase [Demequina salsinemoris]|uniref:zinc-dependent alcohol dehydrogenase n=1 Tax=Demequina salsinemoris TaxID=577470 RepID=UPI000785EE9A|nr:alcohol dehydrogenase catalytic domain-containing protein [Demequina salsinemoris]
MRAFVITAPGRGEVQEVATPVAEPGTVVVRVARVGVCGTDSEFFSGHMAYLDSGHARYPIRIGHEWCGEVTQIGAGVEETWLGRRVTGDTMLGCRECARCRSGRQHLCERRSEIGIRNGWPGALAEYLMVPETSLVPLSDAVDDTLGALVEPGGNALRSVRGANLSPGSRLLVIGAGAIGLLVGQMARAELAEVHFLARSERSAAFARSLGFAHVFHADALAEQPLFDAVVDASNDAGAPALAASLVEPGGRLVFVGLAGTPSVLDTRTIALNDVTAVGVLSASGGLEGTADLYASGAVDPRPLVAATVGLDDVAAVLHGERPDGAGAGPKIHVDPQRL